MFFYELKVLATKIYTYVSGSVACTFKQSRGPPQDCSDKQRSVLSEQHMHICIIIIYHKYVKHLG